MTEDRLSAIFAEGAADWLSQPAKAGYSADEVIQLLDAQAYFDLLAVPHPTSREGVDECFCRHCPGASPTCLRKVAANALGEL